MSEIVAAPGVANVVPMDLLQPSGAPITTGTADFYLIALDGTNAGKWFDGSDDSWSATETVGEAATHKARGHWIASFPAAAWIEGVTYLLYAVDSGDLCVGYHVRVTCALPSLIALACLVAAGSSVEDTVGLPADSLAAFLRGFVRGDTTTNPGNLTVFKSDGNELCQIQLTYDENALPVTGAAIVG